MDDYPGSRYEHYTHPLEDEGTFERILKARRHSPTPGKSPRFKDKRTPLWMFDGRIDPYLRVALPELAKIDPHIHETSNEQVIDQLEREAVLEGYY